MDTGRVLIVENLSKKFCRNLKHSMVYGLQDVLRDWIGVPYNRGTLRDTEFWALDDISFELIKGETLGIIGRNGSGKSTLLRLLTGIFPPDRGRIESRGRIAALIAVGAGFHPHLTGRENIYLNGTILGMTRQEIQKKMDAIVDFADIGDFLNAPVATYSSGMNVRLGFSIAIHAPIEILLADEVLAVGDLAFRVKCFNKIGELRNQGVSTLLVSHDMYQISLFSDKVLLLDNGKMKHFGNVEKGIEIYLENYLDSATNQGEIEVPIYGSNEFVIGSIEYNPDLKDNKISLEKGETLTVTVHYFAAKDFDNVELNALLNLAIPTPTPFFQDTNLSSNQPIHIKKGKGQLSFAIKNINVNNFRLFMNFSLWLENRKSLVLWVKKVPIYVHGNVLSSGFTFYDMDFKIHS